MKNLEHEKLVLETGTDRLTAEHTGKGQFTICGFDGFSDRRTAITLTRGQLLKLIMWSKLAFIYDVARGERKTG